MYDNLCMYVGQTLSATPTVWLMFILYVCGATAVLRVADIVDLL
jgi:hypothetical protein